MFVQERMSGYKIVDTWIYVRSIYQNSQAELDTWPWGETDIKEHFSLATCPYSHNPIIAIITHVLPYPRD
jgi:hypothetical protein